MDHPREIIVFGSSGHAKVVIDTIEKEAKYKIIGLIDDFKAVGESTFGYKVLGKCTDLELVSSKYNLYNGIIAIGDNSVRSRIAKEVHQKAPSFRFISTIHPYSSIGRDVKIGDGVVVMAGAIINSNTTIGNHCIINTKSSIDHDCSLDNFIHLSPGVTVGGNVRIGEGTTVSIGSVVCRNISIGKHAVVGAGSTVLDNIDDLCLYYGTPAKKIRNRQADERIY